MALMVRPKTLKILQKSVEKTLEDTNVGNNFPNRTPIDQQ
jgi:hypothetical protein